MIRDRSGRQEPVFVPPGLVREVFFGSSPDGGVRLGTNGGIPPELFRVAVDSGLYTLDLLSDAVPVRLNGIEMTTGRRFALQRGARIEVGEPRTLLHREDPLEAILVLPQAPELERFRWQLAGARSPEEIFAILGPSPATEADRTALNLFLHGEPMATALGLNAPDVPRFGQLPEAGGLRAVVFGMLERIHQTLVGDSEARITVPSGKIYRMFSEVRRRYIADTVSEASALEAMERFMTEVRSGDNDVLWRAITGRILEPEWKPEGIGQLSGLVTAAFTADDAGAEAAVNAVPKLFGLREQVRLGRALDPTWRPS